jgi:hypothetical protein
MCLTSSGLGHFTTDYLRLSNTSTPTKWPCHSIISNAIPAQTSTYHTAIVVHESYHIERGLGIFKIELLTLYSLK